VTQLYIERYIYALKCNIVSSSCRFFEGIETTGMENDVLYREVKFITAMVDVLSYPLSVLCSDTCWSPGTCGTLQNHILHLEHL
jgi:hypothetical protein